METRFCIEYVNPRHPLRDNGSINVRYDRVLTLEQAEHDLTLIKSFGGKILDLYMGNVVDGETGEWNPTPMIVDKDDWFTTDWLKSLEDRYTWKPSSEQMEALEQFISEYKDIDDNFRAYPISHNIESLYNDLKKLTD